ncbi:MAG: sugar ABC transporter ATP-binding protein [Candidatus Sulfotelmatobacter sp.]|jgi:ribose transport system ATP-binding protein
MHDSATQALQPPLLQVVGAEKHFGATRALDGVDLEVHRGKVHAIIGENGAGKSTLLNILSGAVRPDGGSIFFQGLSYHPSDPLEALRRGIAYIHQELSLCPHLSVAENILLGTEPRRGGWLDQRKMNQMAGQILELFHHPNITPECRVADLTIAERQIVEICRALAQHPSLILMDEPTSSLQRADVKKLFEFIRHLRDSGIGIIYISHFLEEVREIGDEFTVLRDGKRVLCGRLHDATDANLIAAMVGRPLQELFPARACVSTTESVLSVEALRSRPALHHASFNLRRGEVLGISGLIGSGCTELLRAVFGLDHADGGSVAVFGKPLSLRGGPKTRIAAGVGWLSEDRNGEGLALTLSVADNISLTNFRTCSRGGWIDLAKQQQQAKECADAVNIKAPSMTVPVQYLSGGNQQRVVLARLLHQGCEIFLLDEPTRGVDVGSKKQIYELIASLARSGNAVLIVSSYLPELFGICDRLAVMSRGYLSAARPIDEWTPETVLQAAIGADIKGTSLPGAIPG